jgi:hypothetical protein
MHAVHAVKSALQALGLDRILPPQVIAWYSLYLGRKTGGPLGVTIKCAGDKLILRKGDRVLVVSKGHSIYATDLALDFDVLHESVEGEKTAEGDVVDFSVPKWHELKGCGKRMYLTAFTEGESLNDVYLIDLRVIG